MARRRHEETRSFAQGQEIWTWWRRAVTLVLAVLSVTAMGTTTEAAESPTPGGFVESATAGQVRARVKPQLPARGPFTFPQPYNTTGVRLTNADDCGGADCVNYIGYSYWNDVTGRYFIWTSNVGGDRLDAFIVKVPGERLGAVPVSTSAPTILVSASAPTVPLSTSAPTIEVSTSARTLNAGDVLTVGLTVHNGPTGVPLDLYVGLYLPDNQIAYFSSPGLAGLSDLPSTTPTSMQLVPAGASLTLPRFVQVALPLGAPPGTYQFFAALVTPGAVSDDAVSDSDLAAFELVAFTIAP